MGCWGITAFESDSGLNAVDDIRNNLPQDGKMTLDNMIDVLQRRRWNIPPVKDAEAHTGPMALAEILIKFMDHDMSGLDYDGSLTKKYNKFSAVTSFTASKASLRWLRGYLSDTLKYARKNAKFQAKYGSKWNDWFEEKDWIGWQEHMTNLVSRLDTLIVSMGDRVELLTSQEQCSEAPENKDCGNKTEPEKEKLPRKCHDTER